MGPAKTHRLFFLTAIKHVLKGKCPILTRKITTKLGKTKGQMVPFSRMHLPMYSDFPAFLCSGNPHNLNNLQVCHVHLRNLSRATSWFGFAARQLPKIRDRCWCAIDVGESSVQFLHNLILQTFFRVIDYAECHYTFLKINSQIIFLCV